MEKVTEESQARKFSIKPSHTPSLKQHEKNPSPNTYGALYPEGPSRGKARADIRGKLPILLIS